MLLNTKEMSGVLVKTRSGQMVGKVSSFDLDSATGRLMRLHVKTGGLVAGLLHNELFVVASSIQEMSQQGVIINDAAVTEESHASATEIGVFASLPGVFGKGS